MIEKIINYVEDEAPGFLDGFKFLSFEFFFYGVFIFLFVIFVVLAIIVGASHYSVYLNRVQYKADQYNRISKKQFRDCMSQEKHRPQGQRFCVNDRVQGIQHANDQIPWWAPVRRLKLDDE